MKKILLLLFLSLLHLELYAQMDSLLFVRSYQVDPESRGELGVEIESQAFFKDLEYSGEPVAGYTLPGFTLQPKLTYNPLSNLHLELGAHSVFYWGAAKYPTGTFHSFPSTSMKGGGAGAHFMPFFRANLQVGKWGHIVLGDVYGGQNHRLIEPLYNPELNLCADPEVGLQVILDFPHWHFDMWADWQSFIFTGDDHQESFVVGATSDLKFGRFTIPIQAVFRHIGGEVQDSTYHGEVITLFNSSVGLRYEQPIRLPWFSRLTLEAHGLYYSQMSGHVYERENGFGLYAAAIADFLPGLRVRLAYFKAHDFVSLLGNGHYSAMDSYEANKFYDNPQTLNLAIEYSRELSKAFAIGGRAEGFCYSPARNHLGYSAGVFLKVNPHFIIKKFTSAPKGGK